MHQQVVVQRMCMMDGRNTYHMCPRREMIINTTASLRGGTTAFLRRVRVVVCRKLSAFSIYCIERRTNQKYVTLKIYTYNIHQNIYSIGTRAHIYINISYANILLFFVSFYSVHFLGTQRVWCIIPSYNTTFFRCDAGLPSRETLTTALVELGHLARVH